jgi:hypothetical protein
MEEEREENCSVATWLQPGVSPAREVNTPNAPHRLLGVNLLRASEEPMEEWTTENNGPVFVSMWVNFEIFIHFP